jgi:DNA polymerase-1
MKNKKVLLIDGINLLFRGYYALPLLTAPAGEYTNAVYGFLNMLFRFLDEEQPEYIVVAFDTAHPTFRNSLYSEYKGNRIAKPEEVAQLYPQIELMKNLLGKMRIAVSECPGYEADDVIGTLAALAAARGMDVVILSGDRDLLQLATDTVKIRLPRSSRGQTTVEDYYAADVMAKKGVTPREYIEVKALMGDSSDNIPGVPGIGEVTATKIIAAYGSVENAIAHASEIKPQKASDNLLQYQAQAMLSKELATIVTDVPMEWDCDTSLLTDMYNEEALKEFTRLELKNFLPRFRTAQAAEPAVDCKIIEHEAEVNTFFTALPAAAFYLLADGDTITGLAVAEPDQPPAYFPLANIFPKAVRQWFESETPKLAYDSKHERRLLQKQGISLNNLIFDCLLAGYVLNDPADIPSMEEVLNNKGKRGKDRRGIADIPKKTAAKYATGVAAAIDKAYPLMMEKLKANNQKALYETIELPLAAILAGMETAGIQVDAAILSGYGKQLDEGITQLTHAVYEIAGEEFNIQSPVQLGHILFDKLGLKGTKKTTRGWSTAAEVLEKLASKHPIIPLVLEYRALTKLKSTYADGLLAVTDPNTSRVHSTFHQALTATGRLSSAEPNLQNIPVRTPLGRELRRAFVAPDADTLLMDADYSQIELRILAHMSGDESFINAFIEGQDIHRLTAAQVLHIPPEAVTPAQRNNAKAVNFGIVYGISAFGLSEDLQISKKEAERYIRGYFEKYPKVKRYLDESIESAKAKGYAETLFNRRRAIPELFSPNFNTRGFGERVAMNMPIQGTAADIIKIAMVRVERRLNEEKAASRLILQVHDELLLEVKKTELEAIRLLVKEEMENAARLSVPLVADINTGVSWYETK